MPSVAGTVARLALRHRDGSPDQPYGTRGQACREAASRRDPFPWPVPYWDRP